jgi:hypothetical protein
MDAETTPAFLDFKLVFKSTDEPVKHEDPTRQYRFEGFKAGAQLEATIRVPSIDFIFKTDPLENSQCDFAEMGTKSTESTTRQQKDRSLAVHLRRQCGLFDSLVECSGVCSLWHHDMSLVATPR